MGAKNSIGNQIYWNVGDLGISQFIEDISTTMRSSSSWDRHWRRKGSVSNLEPGDIMIYSFKDQDEWFVIGEGVLLYDGIKEEHPTCEIQAGSEWSCCYHFSDFRIYSRIISYEEMRDKLSSFKPDRSKVVRLSPEDYVRMLKLTVIQREY